MPNTTILLSLPDDLRFWLIAMATTAGITPGDVIRATIVFAKQQHSK
jgi:hypothetical protein